uniref:Ninjurin 2 n=1 Tax=Nothobranchius rachovii TaxID=451742 RepID=A0A1A8NIC6_9TELE
MSLEKEKCRVGLQRDVTVVHDGLKARRDLNVVSNQKRLDYLNNVATGVIFVTTVVNFFVSFFGSKRTGFFRWLLARLHF